MAANGIGSYYENAAAQIIQRSPVPQTKYLPGESIPRQVTTVKPPRAYTPNEEEFYAKDQRGRRRPNHEFIREHFLREGRLTEDQVMLILSQTTEILSSEPNVLKVKSPVTGAPMPQH